ncbi:MAG: histidine--tRNA ligase [Planctomycetota bacterium]|nr:MAG: histidine--tRNA ligase [Planctomycetota bacterium]
MSSRSLITPRTLKGFRDYLPEVMIPRERLMETAREVYRSFGFSPIDTPALEYTAILLGKGGDETDKQLYRFEDKGGRDVALRFDLTVPLARFVAQHGQELGMPFKRYHIGPVWRGENTQRGRFREFIQCDFDTIGTESIVSDIETAVVIHELFAKLGFERFVIRVNDRKVLTGVLERVGLADRAAPVLRALDKLAKVGPDKVAAEIVAEAGASDKEAREVLRVATLDGSNADMLERLAPLVEGSETGRAGLESLRELLAGASAAGVGAERLRLDPSIARGLDYYTGTVFETFLGDLEDIGSVCSGGRYDDLASVYTKERLPGIGASMGLDRLLAAMQELGLVEAVRTPAPIFLPFFAADRRDDYLALASRLRAAGFGTELYPKARKLGAQLKYADRRGHAVAVIIGEDEWAAGTCQVKDLATGASEEVALSELTAVLGRTLAGRK